MTEILKDFSIAVGEEEGDYDNVSLIRNSLGGNKKNEGKISEIKRELDIILRPNICPLNNNLNKKTIKDFIDNSNFGVATVDFFGQIELSNSVFLEKISPYLTEGGEIDMDKIKEIEKQFNIYKLGEPCNENNSWESFLISESENKQLLDILSKTENIIFEISSKSSIEGILRTLYNRLGELLPVDRVCFANIYFEENTMKAKASTSFDLSGETPIPTKKGKEISPESNLYYLIENKEFRLIEDLEKWVQEYSVNSDFTNKLIEGGYKSSMTFPLFGKDGEPMGILFLNSTQKNSYSDMHLNILRQIISYVRSNIENIKNYEKINEESKRDGLTGLYNRQEFESVKDNTMPIELYESFEEGQIREYNLIFFDIDYFKNLNDKFGHIIGDEVLKRIGNLLKSLPLVGDNGRAFRVGGEEFAIILDSRNVSNIKQFVTELQDQINTMEIPVEGNNGDETINISASFGVVTFNNQSVIENNSTKKVIQQNLEKVYNLVDKLLYISKENGRNQTSIFNQNLTIMSPQGLKLLDSDTYDYLSEIEGEGNTISSYSESIKGRKISSQEVLKEVFLKNIDLFKGIDDELLYELSKQFYMEYFQEGENIITKGNQPKKIFILREGSLRVKIGEENFEPADKYIQPGELIGEIAFLQNRNYSHTVESIRDSSVWSIDVENFKYIIEKSNELLERIKNLKKIREEENREKENKKS